MTQSASFIPILEADLTCPVCDHVQRLDIPPDY